MSQLSRDLKKSHKAAYAAGSSRNHRTQWRTYLYFTLHFNLVFLPSSLPTICLYCQFLSRSLTPPLIRNYMSSVRLFQLMLGFRFPIFLRMSFNITLSVLPPFITPQLLRTLASCGVDFDPSDVTFSCAFLFAFFLFARISNLVPQSLVASGVHDCKRIYRGDVVPTHYGLCVNFTWS